MSNPKLPVVSTFWHGGQLPLWSRFCLESFVAAGHSMQVYTFDDTLDVPVGASLRDAAEILPESAVFHYKRGRWVGSVSGFSNVFRYKLLSESGGYWVDADVVCLRPFPLFERATVSREDANRINGAVIFAPQGDPAMADAYDRASKLGENAVWGQAGPVLLTDFALSGRYDLDVLAPATFYPLHWKEVVPKLLLPSRAAEAAALCENSLAIHLYNEIFRRFRISPDKLPPRGSFMDALMDGAVDLQADRMSRTEILGKYFGYYARRAPSKLIEVVARRSSLSR